MLILSFYYRIKIRINLYHGYLSILTNFNCTNFNNVNYKFEEYKLFTNNVNFTRYCPFVSNSTGSKSVIAKFSPSSTI